MSVVGYGVFVFAAAPIGGYTPGSTLDPDCAPGSTDCVVAFVAGGTGSPAGSNNQIQINQSGSFFADSTFQKSDTDFNVGLDHTQQSAVSFTGSGLDDLTIFVNAFSGTYPTTYTVTVVGLNKDVLNVETSSTTGGTFNVGDTIVNGFGASATIDVISYTPDGITVLVLSSLTGSFSPLDSVSNGLGVSSIVDVQQVRDTISWTDGTTTIPETTFFASNSVIGRLSADTGHTLSDSWTWTYTTVNQNVLDFSNNDYKFQSTFGTDTFGYQINDNLLGYGITGSANTYTNVAGDNMITGYADPTGLGSIGFISMNLYSTGEQSVISANKNGVGYSIQDSYGENVIQTSLGVTTLGNLSGGNNTKITIDDIAQTINFNNNYSFPFADGTANQVLTTDGAGQLSWTTVSGGSLPSQTGHAGEYLTTDGTNASWTTIAGGGITSIGTINSQTRSANGAVISGNSLVLQTGNGILPGLLIGETTGTTVKLGVNAGLSAVTSLDNVFIGINAGQEAASITDEVYIGHWAGYQATNSWNNNYIGRCAGCYSSNNLASNFIGTSAGTNASYSGAANFFGNGAGANAVRGSSSTFIGNQTGENSQGAANAIFIGTSAGRGDQLTNYLSSDSTVPTVTYSDTSILIGHRTSTGNFKNSIAIGAYATNTSENQFMIGSTARPINEVVIKGSGTCSIVSTGISCSSDERLKTNITDLENTMLDTVSNIRTVRYNWNSSPTGNKTIGFLAQDLEQYYPELVRTDADGFKMVNYAQMAPILVEAIREMNLHITQIANISETNTWRDSLIAWFGNIENGITKLFVKEIESEVIKTKDIQADKLCLEDICVTKDQLQQLLQQGQMSNNDNVPTVTVNTDPDLVITDTSPVDPGNTDPVLDDTSNSTDQDTDQTTVADDVLTEQPPE